MYFIQCLLLNLKFIQQIILNNNNNNSKTLTGTQCVVMFWPCVKMSVKLKL